MSLQPTGHTPTSGDFFEIVSSVYNTFSIHSVLNKRSRAVLDMTPLKYYVTYYFFFLNSVLSKRLFSTILLSH